MTEIAWATLGLLAACVFGNLYWIGSRIDALGSRLDARIDALATRVDALADRIDALAARLDDHIHPSNHP